MDTGKDRIITKLTAMLLCVGFVVLMLFSGVRNVHAREQTLAVLISREISPYISAVNGLESALTNIQVQRFFLDKNNVPYRLSGLSATLKPEHYTALVAIGPSALRYLLARQVTPPVLFGMILNPQSLFKDDLCPSGGVSLNLPIETQFTVLLNRMPWLKRLGVLFDPVNNQTWYDQAAAIATRTGFDLVPLKIDGSVGSMDVAGDFLNLDAILFIPDSSVISEVVIQHIIKQAFLRKIPVIGYNKFFLDSGAMLSFMVDYEQVGRQLAGLVKQQLVTGVSVGVIPPNFKLQVNEEAWDILQLGHNNKGQ